METWFCIQRRQSIKNQLWMWIIELFSCERKIILLRHFNKILFLTHLICSCPKMTKFNVGRVESISYYILPLVSVIHPEWANCIFIIFLLFKKRQLTLAERNQQSIRTSPAGKTINRFNWLRVACGFPCGLWSGRCSLELTRTRQSLE